MSRSVRNRCSNLLLAVAFALTAWFVLEPTGGDRQAATAVDIGTAATSSHQRSGGAARTTESVRYEDKDLQLLAAHRVVDGQLVDVDALAARDRDLWALVRSVLPAEQLVKVHQLNVATDGRGSTLAMVHRSTTERDAWILTVDPAEEPSVVRPTVVHELGHMLTLGNDDLDPSRNRCDGVLIEIGCARRGSTLGDYATAFWSGVAEPATAGAGFVSDYAATSVHEDLAETFMSWVYGDAAPDAAVAAKYDFLAGRADMTTTRDAVRALLAL